MERWPPCKINYCDSAANIEISQLMAALVESGPNEGCCPGPGDGSRHYGHVMFTEDAAGEEGRWGLAWGQSCFARCLMVVEDHANCLSNEDFAHHGFEVLLIVLGFVQILLCSNSASNRCWF